jgi:predicted ATPase
VVAENLRGIFILDPKPSNMRGFSRLGENLRKDGSNIAGVLMAIPQEQRERVQTEITRLASKIPEKDIKRVWAEYVGRHNSDAMLYCLEEWGANGEFEVDARGMSDGTLRFIAVVGALLLRPERSTIVVEEIDNGLHPSRALLLLSAICKIAEDRNIDILITTHNVALLDSLQPSLIRSISIATRGADDGASEIIALDSMPLLGRMVAEGEVGTLSKRGTLERSIKQYMQDA